MSFRLQPASTATAFLVVVIWLVAAAGTYGIELDNPQNDPDLARALRFSYVNKPMSERAGTSRARAEEAYLEYLPRENDPIRRATIYFHLGAMYGVGRSDQGEPKDRDKADQYLSAAIAAAPDAVSRDLLIVRTQWASIPADKDVRFQRDIEVLQYLNSLDAERLEEALVFRETEPWEKIDQVVVVRREDGSVERLGSKFSYDPAVAKQELLQKVARLSSALASSQRTNLLVAAMKSPLPEVKLNKLIETFPEDEIADRARAALEQVLER